MVLCELSDFAEFVLENQHKKENYREWLSLPGKNMNYLVADFIIRIKNAAMANRKVVEMPFSNINKNIGIYNSISNFFKKF